MPAKYQVTPKKTEPRYPSISIYSHLEAEGCLGCLECVKRTSCIYDVYQKRKFDPHHIIDSADTLCLNCMRCVQECKKGVLSKAVNPRYRQLGDEYWNPELLTRIWKQAESGKIPVSGAGYNGPFIGPGFDNMWTDMSEIVRPTRDGIHGREYISTIIELGRRPLALEFDQAGGLLTQLPPFKEITIPIILDIPPCGLSGPSTRKAIAEAARSLRTLAVAQFEEAKGFLADYHKDLMVRCNPDTDDLGLLSDIPIIEIPYSQEVLKKAERIKTRYPNSVLSLRLPLDEQAEERAVKLTKEGAEILYLQAAHNGQGLGKRHKEFITILVREIHQRLIQEGIREQVTLLISGGIAMAEHVAKIIICGADGVGVDLPLLIALECRLCSDCVTYGDCPVKINDPPVEWGAQRLVNLFASWHSQLLEILGAMGIREVRRLRGETGRAMFFEDLEKECFAPIFKKNKKNPRLTDSQKQKKEDKSTPEKLSPLIRSAVKSSIVNRHIIKRSVVSYCPSRFRHSLSKYKVIRTSSCITCGNCIEACSYGVHKKGGPRMLSPVSSLCHGPEKCLEEKSFCVEKCPQGAIKVGQNPLWETFGDPRWPADLIVSTWAQAETGELPKQNLEYKKGASGGGFDKMDFSFPETPPKPNLKLETIDLRIPLNRREDNRPQVMINFPIYGGGMSFGAISLTTLISRARAYKLFNSFTCTGEGGYPEELLEYKDHVITQVATGLFGVREETIQRARIVEFKYAQGAKPGLGGHLLGDKVTPIVAKMREAVQGSSLFSPFPFHSVYSVEDHKKHVDWIKMINPQALVSVKVSTPIDVDMVAVGSYYAGAHIIHLDGSYGGTGAAPDIAKKNIAMPIEYAIPKVHNFLVQEGIRDKITLIASGGIRSAWDVAKAIALGANGAVICTAEMVAMECIRCGNCESGRGCPRGIATTDPELSQMYSSEWATQRLVNLFYSWYRQLQGILFKLGMENISELVGRSDLLIHHDYQ